MATTIAKLSIAATSPSQAEGNSGSTPFTFTVTRTGDTSGNSSVDYRVIGSLLVAGSESEADAADFVGGEFPKGTVTFAAGETSKTITINVAGDADAEVNEGFAVVLIDPVGAITGADNVAHGLILNDDSGSPPPKLSIAATSPSQVEGNSGSTPFTFTVTRSGDTSGNSSVDYRVIGTILAPGSESEADAADFVGGVLPRGTVSFAAGETSKTITINVAGDADAEVNEGFAVVLIDPVGAITGADNVARGLILNDDSGSPPPKLSIAATSPAQVEGNSGSTPFTFTVTRSGDTSGISSVDYRVIGTILAPGSESEANAADFVGGVFPKGTVTFAAGETSKTITINVAGDADAEVNEGFAVVLIDPVGAITGADNVARGLILNDDAMAPRRWRGPDFTGDGTSDILLRNGTTGQLAVWSMANFAASGAVVGAVAPVDWQVQGLGDFDGDGKADLLYRHTGSGDIAVWTMDGASVKSAALVGSSLDPRWSAVATGDFTGDGKTDILWRNSETTEVGLWEMNGTTVTRAAAFGSIPSEWVAVGAADLTGDGKADIVWQNTRTNDTGLWEMDGTTVVRTGLIASNSDANWRIGGLADLDGDGKTDLVWRNQATGQVGLWKMDGFTVTQAKVLDSIPDEWAIAGTGDYDGDGRVDILWRNGLDGTIAAWRSVDQNGAIGADPRVIANAAGWDPVRMAGTLAGAG
ncbi:FG-GAP-like repeat-containing protein [Azospirillum formosense]|uniref:FG-GAP-like repeat-containing protein n=1 Tax=Azospirillum formosense TaxID=861533 RepID=UPI00338E298B